MPIHPFLSGQAFDPETIDKMSDALKSVCDTLSLKVVDDVRSGTQHHSPAFDRQRFWAPRDGSIALSDGGFLTNSTQPLWAGAIQARVGPPEVG